MKPTTVEFWRIGAEAGTAGEAAVQAHRERAALLHSMKETLGLEIINWGATDDEQPSEIVELIVVLTPVVIPALATLLKLWLDSRRIEKVRIVRANGTRIEVGSGTPDQIASVLQSADQ
jgi:hypothetical protein